MVCSLNFSGSYNDLKVVLLEIQFKEYERAFIFSLGQLFTCGAWGPELFFIIPYLDKCEKVDMRTSTYKVPSQEVFVNAILYYKVIDATNAFNKDFSCCYPKK